MDGMEGDLELIEDSNSCASCLSTASTECGSPSQVTSCTPQSLVEDSPSEPSSAEGSPSSSSRAASSAHAPFSLETALASQRSTAVYPLPAVKPAGWEETAAYNEQNELHRDVLELLFDLILLPRASLKTGSISPNAKPDIGEICNVRQQHPSGLVLSHQGFGKAAAVLASKLPGRAVKLEASAFRACARELAPDSRQS